MRLTIAVPTDRVDRRRYRAIERRITERLQRAERRQHAERDERDAFARTQRHYADAVYVAGVDATDADLMQAAERLGYSSLADWFARGAPTGDYPAWAADQRRQADAYGEHVRLSDPESLVAPWTDEAIEAGQLNPSAREHAIRYCALCISDHTAEAAEYLDRLQQRSPTAPVESCRSHTRQQHHARRSAHRTTRSRRTPTAARATGDPDPDPDPLSDAPERPGNVALIAAALAGGGAK
jgi:hypothetical protein